MPLREQALVGDRHPGEGLGANLRVHVVVREQHLPRLHHTVHPEQAGVLVLRIRLTSLLWSCIFLLLRLVLLLLLLPRLRLRYCELLSRLLRLTRLLTRSLPLPSGPPGLLSLPRRFGLHFRKA